MYFDKKDLIKFQNDEFLQQEKESNKTIEIDDKISRKNIEIFHFLIFMLNGFMNILITVIQVIYAERSQNFTYFVGCSMFGPFQIIAVLLALSISY